MWHACHLCGDIEFKLNRDRFPNREPESAIHGRPHNIPSGNVLAFGLQMFIEFIELSTGKNIRDATSALPPGIMNNLQNLGSGGN